MAYPNATNPQNLAQIYGGLKDLIPHMEERAFKYVMYSRVLPGRVTLYTDMPGSWNVRKFSEYERPRRAVLKNEGERVEAAKMRRKRTVQIEPQEWSDAYEITDRRSGTDLENIAADTIEALGGSLGLRQEKLLFKQLQSSAYATLGDGTDQFALYMQIAGQQEAAKKGWSGQWFMALHPYQTVGVLTELIDLTKAGVPAFRNDFIAQWRIGGFGNLILIETPLLPRHIVYNLNITAGAGTGADGDTFKLYLGTKDDGTEAITAEITVDATDAPAIADTIDAIEAALNAVTNFPDGWVVGGTALNALTITPPLTYYVDAEDELRLATNEDGDIDGTISASNIIISENTATAKAVMWTPETVALDVRTPMTMGMEMYNEEGYIRMFGKQTYGVEDLRGDRRFHVHTLAYSPFSTAALS
jgi:hypothetical protein